MTTPITTRLHDRGLTLTNLGKVLYPATGTTKAEVVSYYLDVAATVLPHLAGRCVTRVRFPQGVGGYSFYEKNRPSGAPDWLVSQRVESSEGGVDYPVITEPAALVYLANLAALELHAPQWTLQHATLRDQSVVLDPPDEPRATTCVLDLDPGPEAGLEALVTAALLVATRVAADGLVPYLKTTGSKGLQISCPISPTRAETVVRYAAQVSAELARQRPDLFVTTIAKDARQGRIYLDTLVNKAARSCVCAYSLRGRDRPAVATPISFEELAAAAGPEDLRFSPDQVLERVARHGDLFAPVLAEGPSLPVADEPPAVRPQRRRCNQP